MTSTPAQIQFPCPICGSLLRVPTTVVGQKVRCPKCNSIVDAVNAVDAAIPPPAKSISSQEPIPLVGTRESPEAVAGVSFQDPQPVVSRNATGNQAHVQTGTERTMPDGPRVNPLDAKGEETETRALYRRITSEIAKLFVGQQELVLGTMVALFSGGHVLIESVPGLGKTLFVRALGKVLGCKFGRIQFTADLMPSDVTGSPIFNMKTQEFQFRQGPVFTQFLLADEINRAPAKTHAALLEIMQEKNVTVDGFTHELQAPFIVLATQNPVESEGTYNLPEAQLDRFMFKLVANYPTEEQENRILALHSTQKDLNRRLIDELETVSDAANIVRIANAAEQVRVDQKLFEYVNRVVRTTRRWPQFHLGASTRAGISLIQGSRTLAAFCGRDFVVPDDIVQIALPALRHRVSLTAEAEVEGQSIDQLLLDMIKTVEVPRLD